MNVMHLLGAGASADAGAKLARELTPTLVERVNNDPNDRFGRQLSTQVRALNFVVSAIVGHDGRTSGADPTRLPDVERMVSAVRLLSDRSDLEVNPFIAAWDPTVASLEEGSAGGSPQAARDLIAALNRRHPNGTPSPDARGVDRALGKASLAHTTKERSDVFGSLFDVLVHGLIQILDLTPESVSYFAPLVAVRRSDVIEIATLNYDRAVELCCAMEGVPVSVGVESWNETKQLSWADSGVRLIKLHGSVDWSLDANGGFTLGIPPHLNQSAALIFGRREKLRAEGPYLQLLEHFRSTLAKYERLAVVGYSFGDEHINEVIRQWMSATPSRRVLLVDPHATAQWTFPLPGYLTFMAQANRQDQPRRFQILNATAKDYFAESSGKDDDTWFDAPFVASDTPITPA